MLVGSITIGILNTDEVRLGRVLPAILEFLSDASATLVETGIADVTVVSENLSACQADGFLHMLVARMADALIALAMVIGTHIEDRMVFAVVSTDELVILLDKREETVIAILVLAALLHLGQQPRAADDGMSLEKLG